MANLALKFSRCLPFMTPYLSTIVIIIDNDYGIYFNLIRESDKMATVSHDE